MLLLSSGISSSDCEIDGSHCTCCCHESMLYLRIDMFFYSGKILGTVNKILNLSLISTAACTIKKHNNTVN